jgi:5-methylcytosine-specific restriction endonuclease McrA
MSEKRCSKCHQVKVREEDFTISRCNSDGFDLYCKPCKRAVNRETTERYWEGVRLGTILVPVLVEKPCGKCKKTKPLTEFHKNRAMRGGLDNYCKPCKRMSGVQYKQRHMAEFKAYQAAYRAANRDRRIAVNKQYKQDHPEWAAADNRNSSRKRRAHVKGVLCIRFTKEQLRQKMEYWGNRCWMCNGPFEEVDHVKPIARGGPEILANQRPACKPCNYSKRAKWPYPTARIKVSGLQRVE